MDETIFPLVENIIKAYNKKYKDTLNFKLISTYDFRHYLKTEEDVFAEFANEEMFKSLKPYQYAVQTITYMMASSKYDVYFISAGHPVTAGWRDELLKKYFVNYTGNQLILARDKHMIDVDYLIDDNYDNLINGKYNKILFTQGWNKNIALNAQENKKDKIIRVGNWIEIAKLFNVYIAEDLR